MILRVMSLALLLGSNLALAHGEDRPGPNGGEIRMPGAYHTELVKRSDTSFLVYLLDLEFRNPLVKDSKVQMIVKDKGAELTIPCEPNGEAFLCKLEKALKPGDEMKIRSIRLGSKTFGISVYRNQKLGLK